jgi:hypothetical protein
MGAASAAGTSGSQYPILPNPDSYRRRGKASEASLFSGQRRTYPVLQLVEYSIYSHIIRYLKVRKNYARNPIIFVPHGSTISQNI